MSICLVEVLLSQCDFSCFVQFTYLLCVNVYCSSTRITTHVRLGQPEETSSGRIGVKVEESVETLTFRNPPGALAPPEAEGNVGSLPGRRRFRPKGDFALESVSQIC